MAGTHDTAERRRALAGTKRWRRIVGVVALAIALLLVGTGAALTLVTSGFVKSEKIARNVYVEDVRVEGMTVADASAALEREWVPRLSKELALQYPGGSLAIPPSKLGAKLQTDEAAAMAYRVGREGGLLARILTQIRLRRAPVRIDVECSVNEEALDAALADVAGRVNKKPKNAEVEVTDGDKVIVKPEIVGVVVNLEKSKQALLSGLKAVEAQDVKLVVTEQQPDIKADDLRNLDTVLASYTTNFNPGQVGRTRNLTLATIEINKSVVMPGDVFSVNDTVGERSPERGYRRAPIFGEGGNLRDDYGGGLCQVASTLFNTALRANMKIIERSQHNRMVTYVPLGLDAMVSYGSIDMRFRNSLQYPVLILGEVSGDELTFKIIGSKADKAEVKIERSGVGTTGPSTKEIKDPDLEEGKRVLESSGWSGGYATAWRMTKIDGKWEKTWGDSSSYSPGPNVYRVGSKKKDKDKDKTKAGDAETKQPAGADTGAPATSDTGSPPKPVPRIPTPPAGGSRTTPSG
jgi:vancomycin resistance protein YoaR